MFRCRLCRKFSSVAFATLPAVVSLLSAVLSRAAAEWVSSKFPGCKK